MKDTPYHFDGRGRMDIDPGDIVRWVEANPGREYAVSAVTSYAESGKSMIDMIVLRGLGAEWGGSNDRPKVRRHELTLLRKGKT